MGDGERIKLPPCRCLIIIDSPAFVLVAGYKKEGTCSRIRIVCCMLHSPQVMLLLFYNTFRESTDDILILIPPKSKHKHLQTYKWTGAKFSETNKVHHVKLLPSCS
uniref:Uncharacterized protein n=1 Tax=Oryza brachyantha TaxID=4533 RepID=J3NB53_ORYBR